MAQTQRRMIYSKIWASQQVGKLSPIARVLYVGMITLADDDGRLVGDPSYLRGQIFPYDDIGIKDVKEMRNQVEKMKLIKCYEVDDFEYIQHPNWSEYQVIRGDLYKPSTLPSRNGNVTKKIQKSTLSKDKLSKVKISKDNKTTYGEFSKVKLTPEEYIKLVDLMGESNVEILIFELDTYIASKGKQYKSHYATIQSWARRKSTEGNKRKQPIISSR